MNLTQVSIPRFDGSKGNYSPGREGTAVDTIVYHWIDGIQAVADKVFADPSRIVSAHFSVQDGDVHQYVKLQDTAFHAGNWGWNLRSVGIEHSAQPGRDLNDGGYHTSAELVFSIARQLRKKVGDLKHIPHNAIVPTECPGTVDIDRIVRGAQALEAEADRPKVILASTRVNVTGGDFYVHVLTTLNVRDTPATDANILYRTYAGDRIGCAKAVKGESIDGNDIWLNLNDHTGGERYMWSGGTDYNTNQSA